MEKTIASSPRSLYMYYILSICKLDSITVINAKTVPVLKQKFCLSISFQTKICVE